MIDYRGAYTYQIKWILPINKYKNGFIVQRVEIEDPCNIISGYRKPFFEAWRVDDGVVNYDDESSIIYDDSFSNCADGFDSYFIDNAIEYTQNQMNKNGVSQTYIVYKCLVYWVNDENEIANEINDWKKGIQNEIIMAGNLKSSYNEPGILSVEDLQRVFRVDFKLL